MTNPEHDEAFEAYLKRRSVLPHAVDDRLEPPAALDQIVLNEARDALRTRSGPTLATVAGPAAAASAATAPAPATNGAGPAQAPARKQNDRAPRWAVPVALAATILLCLSVVMNVSLNTNRPSPNLQRATAARADLKASATTDARGNGGTVNYSERRESVSGDIPSNEVILPEAKVAGLPARHAPVQAESALAPSPPSAPIPAAQARSPASAAEAGPPPADEEPRVAAKSAADKAVLFAKRAGTSAPGSAPAADPYPAAPARPAAPATSGTLGEINSAAAPSAAKRSATADSLQAPSAGGPGTAGAGADAAPPAAHNQATPASQAPAAVPHPADPKVWLRQIDALRAAGKTGQADAEIQRFRAAFPGYVAKPSPPPSTEAPK